MVEKDVSGNFSAFSSISDILVEIGEPSVDPLLAALNDNYWIRKKGLRKTHITRCEMAEILGKIGNKKALDALIDELETRDDDWNISDCAKRALSMIKDKRIIQIVKNEELLNEVKDGESYSVQYSLDKGADANVREKKGKTVLMIASSIGFIKIVKILIANGADVNAIEEDIGRTALMYSAWRGDTAVVEALLGKGSGVNVQNKFGETALMYAAGEGHTKIVEILLVNGSDVNVTTDSGKTALDFAIMNGYTNIAQLLKKTRKKE